MSDKDGKNKISSDSDSPRYQPDKDYEQAKSNPKFRKFEEFKKYLENTIQDQGNQTIDEVLAYIVKTYFDLLPKLNFDPIKNEFLDLMAKICNKLKQLNYFNLIVNYHQILQKIIDNINQEYNRPFAFYTSDDILIESFYDFELNRGYHNKTFRLKINSKDQKKFTYLIEHFKKYVYTKEHTYFDCDLISSNYPNSFSINIIHKNEFLLLHDDYDWDNSDLYNEKKEILKKFAIYDKDLILNTWNESLFENKEKKIKIKEKGKIYKQKLLNPELSKKEKMENKKKYEERLNIYKAVQKNLIKEEMIIKKNFKMTKRNSGNFKLAFHKIKNIILNIPGCSSSIKDILPYGSCTQCTQTIKSDIEITIITNNSCKITNEKTKELLKQIENYIEENCKQYEKIYLRTTKRTHLLEVTDTELNINIEINCNNFFSIMNSNLIRNYVTYDARVLILLNTIKDWSKIKGINGNHDGYLSSYCYTLMVIFFLQRLDYPLLPIINSHNQLIRTKICDNEYFIEKLLLSPEGVLKSFKTENGNDTIVTLLLKFFIFYGYLFDENNYCIDISNKRLIFRNLEARYLNYLLSNNNYSTYCFIDMFDYTYNPGAYMVIKSSNESLFRRKIRKSLIQLLKGQEKLLCPDGKDDREEDLKEELEKE